jgi:hypothetical protein
MSTTTIGADLAKNAFSVCMVDDTGRVSQRSDEKAAIRVAHLSRQKPTQIATRART